MSIKFLITISQNKKELSKEITQLEKNKSPEDIIRDPYVLDFLGLEAKQKNGTIL